MDQLSNDLNGPYNNFPPPMPPAKTNGKSIAALVMGILAVITPYYSFIPGFILGIIAIIFAILSLKEIKYKNEQGRGLAITGLVCGIVGTILYGIILALLILIFVFYSADTIGIN